MKQACWFMRRHGIMHNTLLLWHFLVTYILAARLNPVSCRISTSSCLVCAPDACHFLSIWSTWPRGFLNLDLMVATSSSEISRTAVSNVISPSMWREQRVIWLTDSNSFSWSSPSQCCKCKLPGSFWLPHIFYWYDHHTYHTSSCWSEHARLWHKLTKLEPAT